MCYHEDMSKVSAHPPEEKHTVPGQQRPAFPETYYSDPRGLDRYVVQEKILMTWRAPSKIERNRSATEKKQLMLIVVFILLILILLGEVTFALMFGLVCGIYGILAITPPTYMECSVTTLGIKVGEKYYFWPDLSQFWWETYGQSKVLHLRVVFPDYQVVKLIVPDIDFAEMEKTIGTYLLYKKPQQTRLEKLKKEIQAKLPIDLEFLQL